MKIKIMFKKISYLLVTLSLFTTATCHAHGGGGHHSHGGGGYHGGGHYEGGYHGHGGYYRDRGYWGGPWYGPSIVIGVPFGGYYAYPEPVCSLIERCYPNGECIETEICE